MSDSDKQEHPFLSNPTNNPFKDNRNQWLTRSLFFEMKTPGFKPKFTLKEAEHKGLPSIKQLYMSYDHIPGYEYEFANEVLGGWEHWERLCASALKPHVAQWREELKIKLKAKGIKSMIKSVAHSDKNAFQAAKYLADEGYLPQQPKRGRPSKEEKERALRESQMVRDELDDDLQRLGLIQGGKSASSS